MPTDLNDKVKHGVLLFIDLEELEDITVKGTEGNIELFHTRNKQRDYYGGVVDKALPLNFVEKLLIIFVYS